MTTVKFISHHDDARTLVVSHRLLNSFVSRAMTYESEDVAAEVDEADVVAPVQSLAAPGWKRRFARIMQPSGGRIVRASTSAASNGFTHIDKRYDLIVVRCQSLSDLVHMGPLAPWLRCAEKSACYVEELWAQSIPSRPGEVWLMRQFDYLFSGCQGSVEPLASAIDKPVLYIPPGIDALSFCPYPDPPERSIDVYSMRRRSSETHAALMKLARQGNFFYMYDSFAAGNVRDPVEHRQLLANLIARSRYFIANRAKIDASSQIGKQEEIGFRFFEGAAAGAVMIGDPPDTPAFREFFDWEDAVVPLAYGSTRIGEVIAELESDPARIARIRADNIQNSLMRHDWVYRWEAILDAVGEEPRLGVSDRRARLRECADTAVDTLLAA